MSTQKNHGYNTLSVHAGSEPNPLTGAVVEPISMCSVYAQSYPGAGKYDYGRSANPNFYPLERTLSALEYTEHATVFSSGVAAMTALITLVKAGDTVIIPTDLYGGTYRVFVQVFGQYQINFVQVDMTDLNALEEALKEGGVRMVYSESPTNPLLQMYDLAEISSLAKKYGALSVCDNTFATPVCQNPIKLGIDVILHSASKYLGGHSDIVAGCLMTNDEDIRGKMDFARKSMGLHLDPMSMFLLRRGIKTLPLRMERHQVNAMTFAKHLEAHPNVERVLYPGLESHPQHAIAKKQMTGYSGMVSAVLSTTLEQAKNIVSSFDVITLAESLGAVESLVQIPASMSNEKIPKDLREKNGLVDGLIRFSVGIEDADDLVADFDQAVAKVLS